MDFYPEVESMTPARRRCLEPPSLLHDARLQLQHRHEAERFLEQLRERLGKFGLELLCLAWPLPQIEQHTLEGPLGTSAFRRDLSSGPSPKQ
jgi:hypothetical protein